GFAQTIIADFYIAIFIKNVPGLQIAVNDAAIVQVRQPLGDFTEEKRRLLNAKPGWRLVENLSQRRAVHVFHNDERHPIGIMFDVKDGDEVRTFEVHALADAAQFDGLVSLDDLEGDLAPAVADGVVNFTESPAAGSALDGIPIQRSIAVF